MTDYNRFRDHELRQAFHRIAKTGTVRVDEIDALELPPAVAHRTKEAARSLAEYRNDPEMKSHGRVKLSADRLARELIDQIPDDHETAAQKAERLAPVDGRAIADRITGRRSI